MSRISRYDKPQDTTVKTFEWNVALYLRLSREDDDVKNESESISSQRALLSKFAKQNPEMNVVDFYVDDGFSGTDFNRPSFQRMWNDIRNGKVNCVIVKDLSRFGRNNIEVSQYLEVVFPTLKIRFISILDDVDTFLNPNSANSNLLIAFKNIMNDEYARDNSIKVKSAMSSYRKRGLYIGSFAPYGYEKDPNNHNRLVIDEEAANIVRRIFDMFLNQNFSLNKIAKVLNNEGVDIPLEYKRKKGLKMKMPFKTVNKIWSASSIKTILTNQMYVGDMVQGRSQMVSYKCHKKIRKNKEDWDIVLNTHEPIISREDFKKTQSRFKISEKPYIKPQNTDIFAGKIKCGDCLSAMRKARSSSKNEYYKCGTHALAPNKCQGHYIKKEKLETVVFEVIKKYIDLSLNVKNIIDGIEKSKFKSSKLSNEKHKQKLENELLSLRNSLTNLYLNLKSKIITEEEYILKKEQTENQIKILENQIITLSTTLNNNKENTHNNFITTFVKYKNFEKLTKDMVQELVEQINVFGKDKIEITFKFQDEFNEVVDYLKEEKLV